MRPPNTHIKLIDFGNATYEKEHHSAVINTRQYRAPEVILNLGWDEHSDLWSVGCILMELYSGELFFNTHDNLEHLALMERAVGKFPAWMLSNAGASAKEEFLVKDAASDGWRLNWPGKARSASSERRVREQHRLSKLVWKKHEELADFAAELLNLEPAERPSAATIMTHPFLSATYND